MKTAVLIPSHIYYPDQLARLERCLESLCTQTVIPDIYVSISFDNDTYKYEFSRLLRIYPTIKFKISAQQKFQMEHLYILCHFITDYDMIMFCDDDDTYLPTRVEQFIKVFEDTYNYCKKMNILFGGVRETYSLDDAPEYWAYGVPPWILVEFFKRIRGYEDLLRYKFADMYLRNYLKRTGGKSIVFATLKYDNKNVQSMYQYTKNNPNSICARQDAYTDTKENANIIIQDNIILSLICEYNDLLIKHMKNASIPLSKLHIVVPEANRIKVLTNILYK